MGPLIHTAIGILLVLSHGIFLGRALVMRKKGGSPARLDRIARSMSHAGLPLAIISGVVVSAFAAQDPGNTPGAGRIIHAILGFTPIITIMAFTPLLSLRRRIPWLLPSINMFLFLVTALIGFMSGNALH